MTKLDKLEKAYDILKVLVDTLDENCVYDHHGYCQSHWLQGPCPIEQAKELINTEPTSFAIPND
jgi:hypothetical protein